MTGQPVRAAIYTRISLAVLNDTTKTDEQERLCRELCERRGWEVAAVFTDLSKSAWKRDRKRPGWKALLTAVAAGELSAIVTYWGDRIVRQPRDLEDLLDLRDTRQITLASIAGQYDFDNKDHRMMMRWEVARACNESDTISQRKIAQYERMRRAGLVRSGGRGGRAFGFKSDGVTHVPEEAAVVRSAADAIIRGHSAGAVVAGLRAQGVLSTAGKPMSQNTLRRLLMSPRVAGLMPGGEREAAWEPVLDRDTWEMVCGVLTVNQANPRAGQGALRLLSGIATCGECGHVLYAGLSGSKKARGARPAQPGSLVYRCPRPGCHKVARSAVLLDAYVTGRTAGRLSRPDNPAAEVDLRDGAAAELASLTARRAETEAFIAGLADAPARRIEVLNRALDSFDAKIAQIRERMTGDSAGRLRARYAGITREEFEGLPLDVRRALVRGCYRVVVLRSSRRGPGFRAEDVIMSPVSSH